MRQAACLLLVLLSSPPFRAAELSPELRSALEQPLKELARELSQERSPEGWSRRRLAYSRAFRPLPDGRWETVAYRDTAEGERMRTERLTLTLAPGRRKSWQVESERHWTFRPRLDETGRDIDHPRHCGHNERNLKFLSQPADITRRLCPDFRRRGWSVVADQS